MKLTPNFEKDDLLTDYAVGMLKDFYLRGNESKHCKWQCDSDS